MQTLDALVPPTVEQLQDVLQFFDRLSAVPQPVIEVPLIITEDVPMRAVLRATQLVEQLVEVPTIISFPMIALLHALLEYRQRTLEQNVDIPAVGGSGTGGGLSGFLPGQNHSVTAEQIVANPVPRPDVAGDLQGFPRGQSATALSEHIAEFPDPGGGRRDFQPVQGSAASSSDSPGQAGESVFSHFSPEENKCEDPARAHGRRELGWVYSVAQHGVRLLLLVAEKQEWCFLVCSSGSPSYPVAWTAWLPVRRHGGFWKNFLFYVPFAALFAPGNLDFAFALVSFSPSVFGCCLWSTSYLGRVLCLVQQ